MLLPLIVFFWPSPMDAVNEANNRTEQDFIIKTFTLQEVRYRTIHQNFDIFYVFLKPKEEDINLSFGTDKIFSSWHEEDFNEFMDSFEPGDQLEVKMYKPEYDEAMSQNLRSIFKGFIRNDNNEVEIYNLKVNGKEFYEQDITNTAVNFRGWWDLSVNNIMIVVFCLLPIAAIIWEIRKKLISSK